MSSKTKSGLYSKNISSAIFPSWQTLVEYPALSTYIFITSHIFSSSSTIRILPILPSI